MVFKTLSENRLISASKYGLFQTCVSRAQNELVSNWGNSFMGRVAIYTRVSTGEQAANVATTSGYLHARPNTSSGRKLDEGIFR